MPATTSPRDTLAKRPLRVLRGVLEAGTPEELASALGPLVARRHSLRDYQHAARELVREREVARAVRTGEPILSDPESAALRAAASRLIGLSAPSPLQRLSDDAFRAVAAERDPEALADRLAACDPEGGWADVPRVRPLLAILLVAAVTEETRRYRIKEAADAALTRRGPRESD